MSLWFVIILSAVISVAVCFLMRWLMSPHKEEAFEIPVAKTWTALDRDNLRRVLESPTGRKLIDRLRATLFAVGVANAQDKVHAEHAAGHTCGYDHCLKQLISLSNSCAEQDKPANDGSKPGEASTAEREFEEYSNRMSP